MWLLPVSCIGVFCAVFIARRIVNFPFGHILQGIRESDTVTLSLGMDPGKYKQTVFAVAACYAGLGRGPIRSLYLLHRSIKFYTRVLYDFINGRIRRHG